MDELMEYVNQKNLFCELFGTQPYDINNPADRARLRDSIESDLSPENLTCDGELPVVEVNRRYRRLKNVQAQLEQVEQHEAIHRALKGII
jgi:hypothetical protein